MNIGEVMKIAHCTLLKEGLPGCRRLLGAYLDLMTEPARMSCLPLMAQIEPTICCNLKCRMCVNPISGRAKKHMSLPEFKKVVDSMPALKKMSLVGAGEPLMNPSLTDMIAYACSRNIETGFATNGMLLDANMGDRVISSGARWVNISVDSASPERYESIRGGADFGRLVKNIKDFKAASDKKNGPEVSVWFVIMKDNMPDLPGVVRLAGQMGVGKVYAQLEHSWSDARIAENMMDRHSDGFKGALTNILIKAKEEAAKAKITFDYVNVPDIGAGRACKWPWKSCYITVGGFVTPCCLQGSDPDVVNFGNIFREDFADIWNKSSYMEFRKSLKSATMPKICSGCTSYHRRMKI